MPPTVYLKAFQEFFTYILWTLHFLSQVFGKFAVFVFGDQANVRNVATVKKLIKSVSFGWLKFSRKNKN